MSFVLRWNPLFDVIRAQLSQGALGRLFMAEVDYVMGWVPGMRSTSGRERRRRGGRRF